MSARKVVVEGLGRLPAFCHAVVAGDFIYVSGTLGTRAGSFDLVEGGTGPQTRQTLRNIEAILGDIGLGFGDVVKTTIFLSDMADFPKVNEIYGAVFEDSPPARSTVEAGGLPGGFLVEIETIAAR